MQHDRTDDAALILVVDPSSNRLDRDDIVAINRAHLDGEAWQKIADRFGTNRKNVQRIVQGRRWRELHPLLAPNLYRPEPMPCVETVPVEQAEQAIDAAMLAARTAFADALAIHRRAA